jgi:MoxR-like ATPase
MSGLPGTVAALQTGLEATGHLADEWLATALFLAVRMGQPLPIEGEPGVGKTAAAKVLSSTLDTPLFAAAMLQRADRAGRHDHVGGIGSSYAPMAPR